MTVIKIQGFEMSSCGDYVRWTDCLGLDHSTALDLLLERCRVGTYDLTTEDAKIFIQAHSKHMAELDNCRKVNGTNHQIGMEKGGLRMLRPQPEGWEQFKARLWSNRHYRKQGLTCLPNFRAWLYSTLGKTPIIHIVFGGRFSIIKYCLQIA